jgi:hypothetical protein
MTASTSGSPGSGSRRGVIVAAAVTAVLLVVAVVALLLGLRGGGGRDTPPSPVAATSSAAQAPVATLPHTTASRTPSPTPSGNPSTTAPDDEPFADFLPASAPTRIEIPGIGLSSDSFVDLTVQRDGPSRCPARTG